MDGVAEGYLEVYMRGLIANGWGGTIWKKWFGKSGVHVDRISYCLCSNANPEWDSNHEIYTWTQRKISYIDIYPLGSWRVPWVLLVDSLVTSDSGTSRWNSSITPRSEFFLLRWSHSPTPGHHLEIDNTIQVHGSFQERLSCHLPRDASTTSVIAFLVLQGIRDCKRCSRKVKMVMWLNYFFIAVTKHPTWNNLVKEEFAWLVVWGFSSSRKKGMESEAALSCASPSLGCLLITQWTGSEEAMVALGWLSPFPSSVGLGSHPHSRRLFFLSLSSLDISSQIQPKWKLTNTLS